MKVIHNESEAVRFALNQMREKEIVIIFYEKLKDILPILFEFKAQAVDHIPPADQVEALEQWMLHPTVGRAILSEIHQ